MSKRLLALQIQFRAYLVTNRIPGSYGIRREILDSLDHNEFRSSAKTVQQIHRTRRHFMRFDDTTLTRREALAGG
jgi:hypothetical protein